MQQISNNLPDKASLPPKPEWIVYEGREEYRLTDEQKNSLELAENRGIRLVKFKDFTINTAFISSIKRIPKETIPSYSATENPGPKGDFELNIELWRKARDDFKAKYGSKRPSKDRKEDE